MDTHVAIWAASTPEYIPDDIRALIASRDNQVFVSVVTIWEIAIKRALGKRTAPPISSVEAEEQFTALGFRFLDVKTQHAVAVEQLPHHHRDPFDRLLVAQAITEPLRLVTYDNRLAAYSDTVIWW